MEYDIEEMKRKLKKYGQEHLLNFYDTLEEKKQKRLLEQIEGIDFELINSLYNKTKNENIHEEVDVKPIEFIDKYKLNGDYKYYEEIGKKAIREGKLAAVTMAGGQGTRLGHNGPKGTFELEVGGKAPIPLFTLLAQTILKARKKYYIRICT